MVENQIDTIDTITAALFHTGNVLLLERARDGKWELVGGHVEVHESFLDAAGREITEETGIVGVDLQRVGLSLFNIKEGQACNAIYAAFLPDSYPMDGITISEEHTGYKWMPVQQALFVPLANKHSSFLACIADRFKL